MPEENQNMGKSVSILNNSSLRDYADSIVAFQNQARQEQMAKASVESDNNIKNLMTSWMTTTNHWVAQDCSRAARIWLVAKWIRDYAALPENWWKDFSNVPDVDLVNSYKAANPDSEQAIWKFVLDKSQICDPNPLYQELGFYWNPQVEEIDDSVEIDDTTGDSNIGANITQSILDIPLNLGNLPFNLIDKGTAWVAKQFSDNDEAINQQLQQNLQRREDLMTLPWVNREDLSYQIPNLVTDLWVTVASSFLPWVWEVKWAEWALKYPKLAKLIKYFGSVEKLVEKYPKLKPFLVGGELWAKDTAIMNALEWEWTTPLELLEWFLVGWAVEKTINSLKWLSTFLQTNWLFTSSKAKEIIKKLKDIWGKAPWKWTVDDLADFMTKHWLTWSRKQIIEKAEQLWKDKKAILNELLSKSESTHQLEEADEALELLIKRLENWLEDAPMLPREWDIVELNDLLAKQGNYTLSDLERIKEKIDDLLRLYNRNWTPTDNKSAALWRETRKTIQRYIEDVAKKEGLWEVALLNNEIQTAYSIADWISNKTLQDTVKNAIWEYWIYWAFSIPVVKDIWDWDYKKALKDWTMALFFGNTWFKTHLWSMLNRMSWTNRYEIDQWIASEWKNKLSESASQEVADILSQDLWFKERAKQYITSLIKEWMIIWWQKWTETVVDNMTN